MTEPRQGLDISVLAQIASEATPSDAPPTLPDGEQPTNANQEGPAPSRDNPRTRSADPRGRTATGRPRSPGTPPPRGNATTAPRTVTREEETRPQYRPGILVEPLTDLYRTMGLVIMPFNQATSTAFLQNAEPCAQAWDELARTDPKMRAFLMSLLQTGGWAKVLVAHAPIAMAAAVSMSPAARELARQQQPPDYQTNETVNPVSNGFDPRGRQPS